MVTSIAPIGQTELSLRFEVPLPPRRISNGPEDGSDCIDEELTSVGLHMIGEDGLLDPIG